MRIIARASPHVPRCSLLYPYAESPGRAATRCLAIIVPPPPTSAYACMYIDTDRHRWHSGTDRHATTLNHTIVPWAPAQRGYETSPLWPVSERVICRPAVVRRASCIVILEATGGSTRRVLHRATGHGEHEPQAQSPWGTPPQCADCNARVRDGDGMYHARPRRTYLAVICFSLGSLKWTLTDPRNRVRSSSC
ncbi:hypothetical protein OH76DRAFT_1113536 [Lentinus brumalis]|uniref:Uncharacterized protein n=1 Tax=Lentinus brumalis TaxID=2498619 RepID=A0A371CV12_9APHY|nr:hypothetical protein OH76DRAFT_1113536 [Polyporus brumalis]